jgi:peptidoglycan/LPS O-acetylase OafA/YrhL
MPPAAVPGQRLRFLDGLRGLACLYVLLFHASTPHIPYPGELSAAMKVLTAWISRGRFSVVFFIVLSGFSIMLPIARSGSGRLTGGLQRFARRRARRILPPYYAALVLSAALIIVYNAIGRRAGLGAPVVEDALGAGSVVSHLLLVHNARFAWAFRINGPMWSVATEWQIYFVFALLFLPLWRRTGNVVSLAIAWVVGALPFFLLPADANLFWACPWFLGSFMFGVTGAVIGFAPGGAYAWVRTRVPWAALAALSFAVIVVLVATKRADSVALPLVDFVVSFFAFSLICACVSRQLHPERSARSLLLRVLGSSVLVELGAFSYSLYLVQHPILRLAERAVAKATSTYDANIGVHLLVVVPITIALAWVFAEFFERPFTSGGLILPAVRRRLAVAPANVQAVVAVEAADGRPESTS